MTRFVGLSGSLRKDSFNTALLQTAAQIAPDDVEIEVVTLHGIPLYDGDVENRSGIPGRVSELKLRIESSDGIIIATPEYNGGVPGVLKNAVDWLSRPPEDIERVFKGRVVGLMGATPGRGGTALAQTAWLSSLRNLGTVPYLQTAMYLRGAHDLFEDGGLADEPTRERLVRYLSGIDEFARAVNADR